MNERGKSIIGKISGDFLMGRATEEVTDPYNSLEIAREHLQTGSIIVIFNHFKGDFFMWARFIQDNLTSLDNTTAMVAMKYLDTKRGLASKGLGFMFPKWEKSHGVTVLPVVQDKDKHLYPNHAKINLQTTLTVRRILKTPGKVVAYSPEGTRGVIGGLGQAEEGADFILRTNKKSMVIPVAAENLSENEPKLLGSKTKITVGKPFFYLDIEDDKAIHPEIETQDLIMQRIAALLPPKKRGHYRQA